MSQCSHDGEREIEDAVDEVLKMKYFINESREMLIRRVEELYTIRQDEFKSIEKADENLPWLNEKRADLDFANGFWGRYKEYLEIEKNSKRKYAVKIVIVLTIAAMLIWMFVYLFFAMFL